MRPAARGLRSATLWFTLLTHLWPLLLSLVLLASCGRPPPSAPLLGRRPPPAAALRDDWLGGSSSFKRAHFERLLDLVAQDPEAIALVERAARDFRREGPSDLFPLFSICPEDTPRDSGGHTFFDFDLAVFSLDIESLAVGKLSPRAQAQFDQALANPALLRYTRKDFPDYVLIKRSMIPRICLVRGLDLATAYETLIHELTHATLRDPHFSQGKASEQGAAAFLEQLVLSPGDEVDAYAAGTRARIRLEKSKERVHRALQRLFDEQGTLTAPRPLLGRAILAPAPAGLGYADTSLIDAQARAIEVERAELITRQKVAESTLAMRQEQRRVLTQNLDVHTRNGEVYRQQAESARARGDRGALAEAQRKGQEAAQAAAEVRRSLPLVEASIRRLEQEVTSLQKALASHPARG